MDPNELNDESIAPCVDCACLVAAAHPCTPNEGKSSLYDVVMWIKRGEMIRQRSKAR